MQPLTTAAIIVLTIFVILLIVFPKQFIIHIVSSIVVYAIIVFIDKKYRSGNDKRGSALNGKLFIENMRRLKL